jgi:catechol 2,3-dioxygenase-like lactoylglutathione lyase family enzyme
MVNQMVPARADSGTAGIHVVQIGMNTSDLSGSLRFYREIFGFSNAGGNVLWGDIMRIQGLDPDARSLIWWMVGAAPFFQLEFFHHSRPIQRPLPADWRPCDHGWVRFGLAVSRLDEVERGLERWGITPATASAGQTGAGRLAFRDPFIGVIVEVSENRSCPCPRATYATSSVEDIKSARRFYGEVIGAELEPLARLHSAEDEALWGLTGVERDGFVARFGDMALEVIEYRKPRGRARRDPLISDQGIMNVALGSRDLGRIRALLERIRADGHQTTFVFEGPETLGTYIVDTGCELEIFATPERFDGAVGFVPAAPFLADFTSGLEEANAQRASESADYSGEGD